MRFAIGSKLGPYQIVALIGAGGMGEVYRAHDPRMGRDVAIKVSAEQFSDRFAQEIHAVASLNHPNICTLHDVGPNYLVMELVEGETLQERIKRVPLQDGSTITKRFVGTSGSSPALDEVLHISSQITDALAAAHAKGIVHRDLKPGNIMIKPDGTVKVLDFGLAKVGVAQAASSDNSPTLSLPQTDAGVILGTTAYMSPEQAEGRPLDPRSDIFSLGVVLYEMLCGRRPFGGDTTLSTIASILRDQPQAPRQLQHEIPARLEGIVLRCLAKKPEERYGSAAEVKRELEKLQKSDGKGITLRRPLAAALAVVLLAALGILGISWYSRVSRTRWVETVVLPQAAQLMDHSQPMAAQKLLKQAEKYAPTSTELIRLREDLHLLPAIIETDPPGADIYCTDYADPKSSDFEHWMHLGRSPLKTDQLPRGGYYRLRAVRQGFETVEAAMFNLLSVPFRMQLHTQNETPQGMVWIPFGAPVQLGATGVTLPTTQIPPAWIDKYEVTNHQFKNFVDAGGYQKHDYWKDRFVENGKGLAWGEAMARFRDATGRPGPSTWEGGTYPDGKADYPVGGVSWYEAAAYAQFVGKSLPTVYNWYEAAGLGVNSLIIALSNFGGQGPTPAGANLGMSPYGNYDMAGNVKEWCANSDGEKRYILGGGWSESSYMFPQADVRSPMARDATFGFRCARYVTPVPETLSGPVMKISPDRSRDEPVDDRTFQVFKGLLSYDKTDLKATLDSVTDDPHWRRENLSFQAAYGNERVILHLYLPKNAKPPYQAVFYFPGAHILFSRTPEEVTSRLMEYIVKSGRAVVLPAYAGTLERGQTPLPIPPSRIRDLVIQYFKDVARSIDYLETRPDIDASKLGYYGVSWGSMAGLIVLGAEPRIKVGVLMAIGAGLPISPEADTWNYAPRVKVPILMLNGRDDSMFPEEISQGPLFKALGTPEKDKRLSIYPGGHVDFLERLDVVKEALDWLDRYLGAV